MTIHRSPLPDVDIPRVPITEYVLQEASGYRTGQPSLTGQPAALTPTPSSPAPFTPSLEGSSSADSDRARPSR